MVKYYENIEIKIDHMTTSLMVTSYSAYCCFSLVKNIFIEKIAPLPDINNKLEFYHSIYSDIETDPAQA